MDDPSELKGFLWTLSVKPGGASTLHVSCLLGDAFGPEETSSESFAEDALDRRDLAVAMDLYAETTPKFPPAPVPRMIRGVELRTTSVLHLNHNVDWPGQSPYSQLILSREIVEGPDRGTLSIAMEISDMTPTSQRAVAVLDGFAQAASRRLTDRAIQRLSGAPTPDAAPSQPRRVFVSYRRVDRELAHRVYNAFRAYGSGAFFRPSLDEHDLPAGELDARLRTAISQSHLLVALATRSYAPPGSWSRREVELAIDLRVPVLPLLFGAERPTEWPGWKTYVTHSFGDIAEVGAKSHSFAQLADLGLRTVMRSKPAAQEVSDRAIEAVEKSETAVSLRLESIGLSGTRFTRGDIVRVWLRARASPFPISRVRVCYGRVGMGFFEVCPDMLLTSGSAEDGEWTGLFVLRGDWPPGEWVLQEATIENRFGSGSSIDPGDWARQGGGGASFVSE